DLASWHYGSFISRGAGSKRRSWRARALPSHAPQTSTSVAPGAMSALAWAISAYVVRPIPISVATAATRASTRTLGMVPTCRASHLRRIVRGAAARRICHGTSGRPGARNVRHAHGHRVHSAEHDGAGDGRSDSGTRGWAAGAAAH